MKNPWKTAAGVCLLLAILTCLNTVRGFNDGTMKLPDDPAERRGFVAALVIVPAAFLVASAFLYKKGSRREAG